MRKRAVTVPELLVMFGLVLIVSLLFVPPHSHNRYSAKRSFCQSNLKQIALAVLMYSQDYDDKYPPVNFGPNQGWIQVIFPYSKSTAIFQCPSTQGSAAGSTDYFYNSVADGVKTIDVKFPASVILTGEGTDDSAPDYAKSALPPNWRTGESVLTRHMDGANFGFMDGHVKWYKRGGLSTYGGSSLSVKFSVQ